MKICIWDIETGTINSPIVCGAATVDGSLYCWRHTQDAAALYPRHGTESAVVRFRRAFTSVDTRPVITVTLSYRVTAGDVAAASQALLRAYGPRQGRIESMSSNGNALECISMDPEVKVRMTDTRLDQALNALWNLIRESEYNRTGKLPSNEHLNHSLQWWLKFGSELKDYDRMDPEVV